MSWIDAARHRLRTLVGRERLAREMEEEIRFHLEQDARYEGAPFGPDAARFAARRRFGHVTGIAEERRRESGLAALDRLSQDLAYAMRQLVRAPGFTLAVTLTLALGIGANATMFAIVDRVMLRAPDGIADADRVVQVRSWRTGRDGGIDTTVLHSHPSYLEFRGMRDVFAGVTAVRGPLDVPVDRGPAAIRARGSLVADDYFETLGVRPALGRFFRIEETDVSRGAAVAVLSHGFWQRRYGGDPGVVGRTLIAGNEPYAIVGVAPRGFPGHTLAASDFWLPLTSARGLLGVGGWEGARGALFLTVMARLGPDVPPSRALARIGVSWTAWQVSPNRALPWPTPYLVSMVPAESASRPEHRVAKLLSGVALLLLLITCANVANLLLARALARRREIAVRLALGIGRGRLAVLFLLDALLLGASGAAVALWVAWLGIPVVREVLFAGTQTTTWSVDGRLVTFTVVTALVAGAMAGIVPAILASRPSLIDALKQGARDGSVHRSRTRIALLVAQGTLSVALLAGTGLFVRSLQRLGDQHLGLDLNRLVVASFSSHGSGLSEEGLREVQDRMRQLALGIPGVKRASLTVGVPFSGVYSMPIRIPGRDSVPGMPRGRGPYLYAAGPDFLHTLGTRLLAGRAFTESDGAGQPVAIVSERMARTIWPAGDAIGSCFVIDLRSTSGQCMTVIGVAEDAHRAGIVEADPWPLYYIPLGQEPSFMDERSLVVRAADPERIIAPLLHAVHSVRGDLPYVSVQRLAESVAPELRPWRLGASVFALFGLLALVVAAIGTYSVTQFSVSQRTHELGVRIALGAQRGDLARMVTGESLRIGAIAALVGVVVVLAAGGLMESMLFQTSPRDPLVLVAVVAVLLTSSVAASVLPAWRATRVDPVTTLKAD